MEYEEIKKQVSNWLDGKLSNPYFGAVIAAWIFINRVIVFSLFNFDKDLTLDERIIFIHNHFKPFNFWIFNGFESTILLSLVVGFCVMPLADVINTIGLTLFKLVHKTKNWFLHKVEPSQWMEVKAHLDVEQKNSELEDEVNKRRGEVKIIQIEIEDLKRGIEIRIKENETEITNLEADFKKQIDKKDSTISEVLKKIKLQEDLINESTNDKNKLRIIYAYYGADKKFNEVTRIVNNIFARPEQLSVDNTTLDGDPIFGIVKTLYIEYEVNQKRSEIRAIEGSIIILKENSFEIVETEDSKRSQIFLEEENKQKQEEENKIMPTLKAEIGSPNKEGINKILEQEEADRQITNKFKDFISFISTVYGLLGLNSNDKNTNKIEFFKKAGVLNISFEKDTLLYLFTNKLSLLNADDAIQKLKQELVNKNIQIDDEKKKLLFYFVTQKIQSTKSLQYHTDNNGRQSTIGYEILFPNKASEDGNYDIIFLSDNKQIPDILIQFNYSFSLDYSDDKMRAFANGIRRYNSKYGKGNYGIIFYFIEDDRIVDTGQEYLYQKALEEINLLNKIRFRIVKLRELNRFDEIFGETVTDIDTYNPNLR